MNYIFVTNVYKLNTILLYSTKRANEHMIAAFESIYVQLEAKRHPPELLLLKNEQKIHTKVLIQEKKQIPQCTTAQSPRQCSTTSCQDSQVLSHYVICHTRLQLSNSTVEKDIKTS